MVEACFRSFVQDDGFNNGSTTIIVIHFRFSSQLNSRSTHESTSRAKLDQYSYGFVALNDNRCDERRDINFGTAEDVTN